MSAAVAIHWPTTRLLTLLRLPRETPAGISFAEGVSAGFPFGEGDFVGFPFAEGDFVGFPFAEARQT